MADIFLSYASADLALARGVAASLQEAGHSVWWDRDLLSGERFQQSIQQELSSAAAVVVVWTKTSIQSEWVYSEARRGNARKVLVQVRDHDVQIDDLPAPFDALHCPSVEDGDALLRSVSALVATTGSSVVSGLSRTPTSSPSGMPSACPTCGSVESANRRFCGECGAPLASSGRVQAQERKIVTVVVAELVTPADGRAAGDPETLQSHRQPYHAAWRQAVERVGGAVEDSVGGTLMALFGVPRAHEDDPERAVRAGLYFLEDVATVGADHRGVLSARAGVATGEAVVSTGTHNGAGHRLVAGEVTDVATRLAAVAPLGRILVSRSVEEQTRATIEYAAQERDQAGGADDATRTWLVVAPRGSAGEQLADTSIPMVGRDDELNQLQRAYMRAVRESAVQLVTVVAEPGLGKSRLVQAFRDWVDQQEELVMWRQGRCAAYGDAGSFDALSQMVKAQVGILDSDAFADASAKLEQAVHAVVAGTDLAEQEPWLVARLSSLVGLPDSEAPQEERFTAWTRFLEALAATGPMVLVVEDLHWADPALLAFLAHLLEWATDVPLVVIATARPELYDAAPTWAAGQRNATALTLTPLDATETSRLVAAALGTRVLPLELHAALLVRAAGNPLYAREYLSMVTDLAGPGIDEARVQELTQSLPGSVQAVIAARLDTLPSESKKLLQAASVIGHTFWSGSLAALLQHDEHLLDQMLRDLSHRDFVRRSRVSTMAGQTEYSFAHALIADVAYSQLPRRERARHHRAVAQWQAERMAEAQAGSEPGWVAHHYTQAYRIIAASDPHDPELPELASKASTWNANAAEYLQTSDVEAALRHAETAVELTAELEPQRARRLILLSALQRLAGRIADSDASLEAAAGYASGQGDQVTEAHAWCLRSHGLRHLGEPDEADRLLEAGIEALERHRAGPELVEAYLELAFVHQVNNRIAQGITAADRALQLIGDQPDVSVDAVVEALRQRGEGRIWSGDPTGIDDLNKALSRAEGAQLTTALIRTTVSLASYHFFAGPAESALPYSERVLEMAERGGYRAAYLNEAGNMADNLTILGRLDDAVELCSRTATVVRGLDSSRDWGTLRVNWARALFVRGDVDEAHDVLDAVSRASETSTTVRAPLLLAAAEYDLVPESRQQRISELLHFLEEESSRMSFSQTLPRLARLLAEADRPDLLSEVIECSPSRLLFFENNVLSARAVLAHTTDQHEAAHELYLEAAEAWSRYGCPFEQACALLGAAQCDTAGDGSRELRERARDLLAAIGARRLVLEVEGLLGAEP